MAPHANQGRSGRGSGPAHKSATIEYPLGTSRAIFCGKPARRSRAASRGFRSGGSRLQFVALLLHRRTHTSRIHRRFSRMAHSDGRAHSASARPSPGSARAPHPRGVPADSSLRAERFASHRPARTVAARRAAAFGILDARTARRRRLPPAPNNCFAPGTLDPSPPDAYSPGRDTRATENQSAATEHRGMGRLAFHPRAKAAICRRRRNQTTRE